MARINHYMEEYSDSTKEILPPDEIFLLSWHFTQKQAVHKRKLELIQENNSYSEKRVKEAEGEYEQTKCTRIRKVFPNVAITFNDTYPPSTVYLD